MINGSKKATKQTTNNERVQQQKSRKVKKDEIFK